jgi:flagellar biosynthesis protein FlhF
MRTQTFTGPSIQAALKKARYALGEDVVLLESVPAQQGNPARIRVMADTPLADTASADQSSPRSPAPSPMPPSSPDARRRLNGYAPRMAATSTAPSGASSTAGWSARTEGSAEQSRENVSESPDLATYLQRRREAAQTQHAAKSNGDGALQEAAPSLNRVRPESGTYRSSGARNRLYSNRQQTTPSVQSDTLAATERSGQQALSTRSDNAPARLLESHLQMLHARLENMERRFGGVIVGASHRWLTHPLYAQLLEKGLRPSTITKLFDRLVERGFEPQENDEELCWAMAQELRRMLSATAPKRTNANYLFIGPSGAGKTSLLLKLARHESFFGRRLPTVISIRPEDDDIPYLSPVPLYRDFGLPVQVVRTPQEMHQALDRVQQFDQVLIDTPPLPFDPEKARPVLRRLQRIVNPLMPLQVHLTLNATRTLDELDENFLRRLPLQPDAVALTHLDEVAKWGRIAEWLLMLDKPVHFVSTGRRVPEGVEAFTPSWFVEEMMQL